MNIKNKNVKIETTLTATILGFKYRDLTKKATNTQGEEYDKVVTDENGEAVKDYSSVQIQSFVFDEEKGQGDVKTFRLNKKTSDEEMAKYVNKTFVFDGILERKIDKNTFITVTSIDKEVQSESPIYNLNKSMVCILDSVVEKERTDKETKAVNYDTTFQIFSINGTQLTQKNIKLKDTRAEKFKALIGKKVRFDGIKVSEFNGAVFFSITEAPKAI